ncbi:Ribosomal RNA large subunit methyltransferase K [Posidoniimonas polymericola]|uniref:Ribosomal RNA large subunit methyltransferase K n=1 Tax=Posidoniimonas polymericola TaxID=2528002 RepID=A0A5C5XWF5_9BACT|nr:bifunctional 23S rRNA (guanine(2069)-N(7))-methyltransferase RlmK/23S rRNA (guanine(2445)-N(2))-methyltransferase RlmL [Posidoniimonas polymericola]TWT67666.1 Ribosomal RNA large subunit methyltransferase K [Posidoniimonas polymericola]
MPFPLVATTAFGVEAVVRRELENLGYEARITGPGRVAFEGDAAAIAQANLWLRSGERVVIEMASFPATDFGQLFDGVNALDWAAWIPVDGEFPVSGRSRNSQLSSVPACQKIVKKSIVERLRAQHGAQELPEIAALYSVEVALVDDIATITLDTTGVGLHKRGYRPMASVAPLRETLAAAIVQLSYWRNGRPLLDPFCGAGTLAIEAAMIGRQMAPGQYRTFASEHWPAIDRTEWETARNQAKARMLPALDERILATDADDEVLAIARRAAERAGVLEDIHFQQRAFADTLSKREYGCLITNPPYGERLGEEREIEELYRTMPLVLRRLKTWSHYVLTSRLDFEDLVGQTANKRRKLYNGRLECTLFQYHGPRPPKEGAPASTAGSSRDESSLPESASPEPSTSQPTTPEQPPERFPGPDAPAEPGAKRQSAPPPARAFGGLRPESERQAEEFANRLKKLARHLRKWPTKRGITCYRIYDRDIPDVPFAVDRYEDALHLAEYDRPHDRTPAEHADWLDHMVRTAADALDVPRELTFLKHRFRQRGETQYQRVAEKQAVRLVKEAGLTFRVNLSDYVDTGLFLDHRVTRGRFRDEAQGKRVLNLFAYTGAFSVYALAGGAERVTTVDLSPTYLDWARDNVRLNKFDAARCDFVQGDSQEFVESLSTQPQFDLAIVDPPTFSNTKRGADDWDVQQHAAPLLVEVAKRMPPGGVIYFSTNSRRFKLDEPLLAGLAIREISRQTVPEDFRNKRIHRCWRMVKE